MSIRLPLRVADYFCLIGAGPPSSPTSKEDEGMKTGASPSVLSRWPSVDHSNAEFPRDLSMFCLPQGIEYSSTALPPEPHTFVLTEADGTRVYGASLLFYELPPPSSSPSTVPSALTKQLSHAKILTSAGTEQTLTLTEIPKSYVSKSLCIVSHWPYYNEFNQFLFSLYKIYREGGIVPLERYIANFIMEVPLPPLGVIEVEYKSMDSSLPLLFKRPPPNRPPLRNYSLRSIFEYLSVDNVLLLFSAVLTEKRVLFHSSSLVKLNICAESISYLIYPFYWRHMFIPILPSLLVDFIAAPFPYIIGTHSSSLPDEIMLDQVIVVDLDNNTISCVNGLDQLAPLPEKRAVSLTKSLKKILGVHDLSVPLKPLYLSSSSYINMNYPHPSPHPINESDIEQCFLKFFVKILCNYRHYLFAAEADSTEKFDRIRFVQENNERDKPAHNSNSSILSPSSFTKGLAAAPSSSNPNKNDFFTDLMDTQLFQCFVDDRYDSNKQTNNLEVLYFDESIVEEESGKKSPFLSDTSHSHSAAKKYICLTPYAEDFPHNTSFKYETGSFPLLDETKVGPIRDVPPLTNDSSSGQAKTDISKIALNFFTSKRLYSQHFHTLRLKSSKQDIVFKSILNYLKQAQQVDEDFCRAFDRLCFQTIEMDHCVTNTSVDECWKGTKRLVSEQGRMENETFRILREEACIPLYTSTAAFEHQLKILFSEANRLETKAGKGKNEVERAKQRDLAMRNKYIKLKETLTANVLSPSEISRIILAKAESEDAALSLDEVETDFETIISEYESRMPEIISSIRTINRERINQYKISMDKWTQSKKRHLEQQLINIKKLERAVGNINSEKDILSFSEGTNDFWQTMGGGLASIHGQGGKGDNKQKYLVVEPDEDEGKGEGVGEGEGSSKDNGVEVSVSRESYIINGGTNNILELVASPVSTNTHFAFPSPSPSSPSAPSPSASSPPSSATTDLSASASLSPSPSPFLRPSSPSLTSNTSHTVGPAFLAGLRRQATPSIATAGADSLSIPTSTASVLSPSFYNTISGGAMRGSASPSSAPPLSPSPLSVSEPLCYPLHLWGNEGYHHAVNNAITTKRELKELSQCLEDWAALWDLKAKKLSSLSRTDSLSLPSQQNKIYESFKLRYFIQSKCYSELVNIIQKKMSDLRVIRGELKYSIKRFSEHKMKLEREVQLSINYFNLMADKLNRANKGLQLVEANAKNLDALSLNQRQIEVQSQIVDRAVREYKDAEGEYLMAERTKIAKQKLHDVCLSRIMKLFEEAERTAGTEIKKAMEIITEGIRLILLGKSKEFDDQMLLQIKNVDFERDLREFIDSTNMANTASTPGSPAPSSSSSASSAASPSPTLSPSSPFSPPPSSLSPSNTTEPTDFSRDLSLAGSNSYNSAVSLLNRSILFIKSLNNITDQLVEIEENDVKSMKKVNFKIKSMRGDSVGGALVSFDIFMDKLAEINEDNCRIIKETGQILDKRKSYVKNILKIKEKLYLEEEKNVKKVMEERDKAMGEERKAEIVYLSAKLKTESQDNNTGSTSPSTPSPSPSPSLSLTPHSTPNTTETMSRAKSFFGNLVGGSSAEQLKSKELNALKEWEKSKLNSRNREMALVNEQSKRDGEMRKILNEFKEVEIKKWATLAGFFNQLINKNSNFIQKMGQITAVWQENIVKIQVDRDIEEFLIKNIQSQSPPPLAVIEDYRKTQIFNKEREAGAGGTAGGGGTTIKSPPQPQQQRLSQGGNQSQSHRSPLNDSFFSGDIASSSPSLSPSPPPPSSPLMPITLSPPSPSPSPAVTRLPTHHSMREGDGNGDIDLAEPLSRSSSSPSTSNSSASSAHHHSSLSAYEPPAIALSATPSSPLTTSPPPPPPPHILNIITSTASTISALPFVSSPSSLSPLPSSPHSPPPPPPETPHSPPPPPPSPLPSPTAATATASASSPAPSPSPVTDPAVPVPVSVSTSTSPHSTQRSSIISSPSRPAALSLRVIATPGPVLPVKKRGNHRNSITGTGGGGAEGLGLSVPSSPRNSNSANAAVSLVPAPVPLPLATTLTEGEGELIDKMEQGGEGEGDPDSEPSPSPSH